MKASLPFYFRCKCGNCSTETLQTSLECYCCTEIEACVSSLSSHRVLAECGTPPTCVTDHPGFRPICLETWPLLAAATKYKKPNKVAGTGRLVQKKSKCNFTHHLLYHMYVFVVTVYSIHHQNYSSYFEQVLLNYRYYLMMNIQSLVFSTCLAQDEG